MFLNLNNFTSDNNVLFLCGSLVIVGGLFTAYIFRDTISNLFSEETPQSSSSLDFRKDAATQTEESSSVIDSTTQTVKSLPVDEFFNQEGLGFYLEGPMDETNIYDAYLNSCKLDFSVFETESGSVSSTSSYEELELIETLPVTFSTDVFAELAFLIL